MEGSWKAHGRLLRPVCLSRGGPNHRFAPPSNASRPAPPCGQGRCARRPGPRRRLAPRLEGARIQRRSRTAGNSPAPGPPAGGTSAWAHLWQEVLPLKPSPDTGNAVRDKRHLGGSRRWASIRGGRPLGPKAPPQPSTPASMRPNFRARRPANSWSARRAAITESSSGSDQPPGRVSLPASSSAGPSGRARSRIRPRSG